MLNRSAPTSTTPRGSGSVLAFARRATSTWTATRARATTCVRSSSATSGRASWTTTSRSDRSRRGARAVPCSRASDDRRCVAPAADDLASPAPVDVLHQAAGAVRPVDAVLHPGRRRPSSCCTGRPSRSDLLGRRLQRDGWS